MAEQNFFIDGPEGKLELTLTVPEERRVGNCLAIICHPHPLYGGTKDNKVVHTLSRAYRDLGYATLRFNFRGVGKSEGSYGEAVGEIDDLAAILDFANDRFNKPDAPLILTLAGFSFGSFIAAKGLEYSRQINLRVDKLVLVAPPVHHYDFRSLVPFGLNLQIIQGTEDEVVPCNEVESWAKLTDGELDLIPEASHFFHGKLLELKSLIKL